MSATGAITKKVNFDLSRIEYTASNGKVIAFINLTDADPSHDYGKEANEAVAYEMEKAF